MNGISNMSIAVRLISRKEVCPAMLNFANHHGPRNNSKVGRTRRWRLASRRHTNNEKEKEKVRKQD